MTEGAVGGGGAPVAVVHGEAVAAAPAALYIPPAAMRVMLRSFEGPLDLLLFLVRKHKFDVMDIPMAQLCRQYGAYVEEVVAVDLALAADYLTMSALLIEIKTKMLLPRQARGEEEDAADPRADLVRRLLEYERFRLAAADIGALPRRGRDFVSPRVRVDLPPAADKPYVQSGQLAAALAALLRRGRAVAPALEIVREGVSVREVMSQVLRRLRGGGRLRFGAMCAPRRGGVTFLAVLQLAFERLVSLRQEEGEAGGEDFSVMLREEAR